MSDEALRAHLLDCFHSAYEVLGERAPLLTRDAYVVRAYETARALGEVALRFRALSPDAPPRRVAAIHDTLASAVTEDESGALVLFAWATLVGPRLLVSLRDAREGELEAATRAASEYASAVTLAEIMAVGSVAQGEALAEEPGWRAAALGLRERLDSGPNAESFGLSR